MTISPPSWRVAWSHADTDVSVVVALRSVDDALAGRLPVLEKRRKPLIGERVLDQLVEDLGRNGRDIGPKPRRLDHVAGMADRGDQHLGGQPVAVVAEDLDDLADELHAVLADVVEAADERRHE